MRRNLTRSAILGLAILVVVVQAASAKPDASQRGMGMPGMLGVPGMPEWGDGADKLWPPSDVVKGYRRASELCYAGKSEEGLALVRKLAGKSLIMGPDTVVTDGNSYLMDFESGRVALLMYGIRNIIRCNSQKANELSKSGDRKAALQILKVDLQVARQVLHARPPSWTSMLTAIGIWRGTWESASRALAASGDTARAASAKQLSARAKRFVGRRLNPYIDKQMADQKSLERRMKGKSEAYIKKQNADYVNNDRAQAGKFIKMWDKEVDSPSYDKLLRP